MSAGDESQHARVGDQGMLVFRADGAYAVQWRDFPPADVLADLLGSTRPAG